MTKFHCNSSLLKMFEDYHSTLSCVILLHNAQIHSNAFVPCVICQCKTSLHSESKTFDSHITESTES